MDNLPSAFRDISPEELRSAPPEAHSCKFCQSLQAQCRSGPSFSENLTLNTTAREVLRNLEQECCCDLVALMASIWRTEMPRRSPSRGDISIDVLFPVSGSDRIPDEVRSHLDDFILILTSEWGAVTPRYEVLHDIVSITSFGFRNALNEDCFQWSFSRPLCVYTTANDPASKCITSRPINTRPDSEETHALARTWLNSCISGEEEHANWCKPPSGNFVPTRLLQLHRHPTRPTFLISLVHPRSQASYAALSYCWGEEQPHKTTSARLEAYRTCITWRVLPQSIQDAVKVTFELGLQYLWVDAFCIVQDDAIDTAREIAQMPQIYSESEVTIVASRASTSYGGFLHDIQPGKLAKSIFKLPLRCSDGTFGSIFLMDAEDDAFKTILETRGWALQEWCLSPRILDYDTVQVHWHCAASAREAGFSNGWCENSRYKGSTIYEEFRQRAEESWRSAEGNDVRNSSEFFALRVWRSLVEIYTRRNLTIPSDRILAISGLAQRCGVIYSDMYLAGLWRRSIEDDLLWTRKDFLYEARPSDRVRPATFQGPTWSWTGINGAVQFRTPPGLSQMSFIGADIRLVEPRAVYGAVKSAVLKLRGRVRPATWGSDGRLYHWNGPLLRFNAIADCEEPGAPRNAADNKADRKDVSFDVYLLQVRSNSRFDEKQNRTFLEHAGLVLRLNSQSSATESSAAGQTAYARFSRLGHFSSMSYGYVMPRPAWRGPEQRGMETHMFFDRCLDQVVELE
ncbi:HET-domain-containing protein [Stipitochalara longipes BDJ]|nr:HET-domain-containing protein [Stipitochalara longipes BDJ]